MKFSDEFRAKFNAAKEQMIGKAFINIKHGTTYFVKGITIDSETLELRVVYNSETNPMDDWDRPLPLFLKKFKLKY